MKKNCALLSSIGQKLLIATSGLVMFILFLIPHMGGNILFLFGPDIFNSYAMHLHQMMPVVIGLRVLMLASITIHMAMTIKMSISNVQARGTRLSQKPSKERSLAARLMPLSGGMIFLFIVKHLLDFTISPPAVQMIEIDGYMAKDVYGMVYTQFQDPVQVIIYLLFMVAVGFHLSHALQSAVQTFGWYVPRKHSKIKLISMWVAIGMASTFAIIPVSALIYFHY